MRRTPLKRTVMRSRRATPRRREAPRWTADEWEKANTLLLARCAGLCEGCGGTLAGRMERAHRVRRRDGGDRLSNILALHPECHAWTHHNPEAAGKFGLILRTNQNPANTPVLQCSTTWVMLDDDGATVPLGLDSDWRMVG